MCSPWATGVPGQVAANAAYAQTLVTGAEQRVQQAVRDEDESDESDESDEGMW